jgi:ketosteroid isomerase-like protein
MPSNLDLVRSIYADWERGDYSSAAWAHPEIEFAIADGPSPTSWRGLTAMANAWRDFLNTYDEYRSEIEEIQELDDDRVLALSKGTAAGSKTTGAATGRHRAGQHGAALFQVRDGRVTRLAVYFDRQNALADFGLSPEGEEP